MFVVQCAIECNDNHNPAKTRIILLCTKVKAHFTLVQNIWFFSLSRLTTAQKKKNHTGECTGMWLNGLN